MENEMENETVQIAINRGGFLSLSDVENYIRETITRYQTLGVVYIQEYSSINYNRGSWSANITLTTRDPNDVNTVGLGWAEPAYEF